MTARLERVLPDDRRTAVVVSAALAMKVPADLYARSPRVYRGLNELTCPLHDQTIMGPGVAASASAAAR